jgi:hypothetical protein
MHRYFQPLERRTWTKSNTVTNKVFGCLSPQLYKLFSINLKDTLCLKFSEGYQYFREDPLLPMERAMQW